ncbi:MAG: class I tRNA ligase family protein [Syntrophaceae bacterium]
MKIFNTLGKRLEEFHPVNPKEVTIFTCGPSVYQRAHIGNFRTFLFEDIVVRYLRYAGYSVKRGMNYTDVEDKAVKEAHNRRVSVAELTAVNIRGFRQEMKELGMEMPDYFPRASENIDNAIDIIEILMEKGTAYRHGRNIYFDPLKFPGFGKLYGLDMKKWPGHRRRFHLDTYPGMRWNLGDFILWHGCGPGERACWDTRIGSGRPSWNVQDQSMILPYFHETLSIYMGGIDNLVRHHDYIIAVLESVRPYPVARYWLHCRHLYVNGKKMSKSLGNIVYTRDVTGNGHSLSELRFFLIYSHYRDRVNYTEKNMAAAASLLRDARSLVKKISSAAKNGPGKKIAGEGGFARDLEAAFRAGMENDLNLKEAFDLLYAVLVKASGGALTTGREAARAMHALREIDGVLGVLFQEI